MCRCNKAQCTFRTRIGPGPSETQGTCSTADVGGKGNEAMSAPRSSNLCLRDNDANRQKVCVCSLSQAPQMDLCNNTSSGELRLVCTAPAGLN